MKQAEKRLVFKALRDAEDYRVGLADAYHNEGPEAEKALDRAREYRALRHKLSKELGLPMRTALEVELDKGELLGLNEIKERIGHK